MVEMRDFFRMTTNQPVGAPHLNASDVLLSVRMTQRLIRGNRGLIWAAVFEPFSVGNVIFASRYGVLAKDRSTLIAFTDELDHCMTRCSTGPVHVSQRLLHLVAESRQLRANAKDAGT